MQPRKKCATFLISLCFGMATLPSAIGQTSSELSHEPPQGTSGIAPDPSPNTYTEMNPSQVKFPRELMRWTRSHIRRQLRESPIEALRAAVVQGDTEELERLLAGDPNTLVEWPVEPRHPLLLAITQGHLSMVEFLVARGAATPWTPKAVEGPTGSPETSISNIPLRKIAPQSSNPSCDLNPINLAVRSRFIEIENFLLQKEVEVCGAVIAIENLMEIMQRGEQQSAGYAPDFGEAFFFGLSEKHSKEHKDQYRLLQAFSKDVGWSKETLRKQGRRYLLYGINKTWKTIKQDLNGALVANESSLRLWMNYRNLISVAHPDSVLVDFSASETLKKPGAKSSPLILGTDFEFPDTTGQGTETLVRGLRTLYEKPGLISRVTGGRREKSPRVRRVLVSITLALPAGAKHAEVLELELGPGQDPRKPDAVFAKAHLYNSARGLNKGVRELELAFGRDFKERFLRWNRAAGIEFGTTALAVQGQGGTCAFRALQNLTHLAISGDFHDTYMDAYSATVAQTNAYRRLARHLNEDEASHELAIRTDPALMRLARYWGVIP